jgi:hydrogenase-4 component B
MSAQVLSQLAVWLVGVLFVTSAVGGCIANRPAGMRVVYATTAIVCAALASCALAVLTMPSHGAVLVTLPIGLPLSTTVLGLDALSAAFAVIINAVCAVVSVYAIGYGARGVEPLRVVPFYPAFIAAMNVVLLAQDAFSFLVGWEVMSLASWALVVSEDRSAANRRAGIVYIIMASGGALTLLLGFGVLAGTQSGYTFEAMRTAASTRTGWAVVLLALIGAGSKAGLVPLHAWLPLAHPAAPSHASALMSGVMTKVAVYGFTRIAFDLAGPPAWWWSVPVLIIAGITALMGVLYALMEHDLKRLLAYHTVENIGIIFVGLGLALAFQANGMKAAAALALVASVFHVANHSLFKSLLFLGSGAVQSATGERDMERLGGLIGKMPLTAATFLVGCVAISALPPFNGFVSEWLTFQAILLSPQLPQWIPRLLVPAVGATLACSAALAAACFVKAFGVTFLGRARSAVTDRAQDPGPWSTGAMAVLAILCLLAGVLPGYVIDGLSAVTDLLLGSRLSPQGDQPWLRIAPIDPARGAYDGLLVFAMIAAAAGATALIARRISSHATRRAPAWDCGFPQSSPSTQYTAGSFAQPIRRVFGTIVFRAREQVSMPRPGDTAAAKLEVNLRDTMWAAFYQPVIQCVSVVTEQLTKFQYLTIRKYLMIVFGALIALLIVVGALR